MFGRVTGGIHWLGDPKFQTLCKYTWTPSLVTAMSRMSMTPTKLSPLAKPRNITVKNADTPKATSCTPSSSDEIGA